MVYELLRAQCFAQEYVSHLARGTPVLPPTADQGEPIVEMPDSTTASPGLSHASTPRGIGRPSGTTSSGGSGGGVDDGFVGGSTCTPYSAYSDAASAQPSGQAPGPLPIAAGTSRDFSNVFRDGSDAFPGIRDEVVEHSSVPLSSQHLLSRSTGEGSGTSLWLNIPRLPRQAAPGLDDEANEASRQGLLIELRQNSGSSAPTPATAGSAFNRAGQQDPSNAGSTGGSATSTFTGGQTPTASGCSTGLHAQYDGWVPRAIVELETQHARATSVLSQGSCRSSERTLCMRPPQDAPANSPMAPHPIASPAVVRRHLPSIAQLLCMPTTRKLVPSTPCVPKMVHCV